MMNDTTPQAMTAEELAICIRDHENALRDGGAEEYTFSTYTVGRLLTTIAAKDAEIAIVKMQRDANRDYANSAVVERDALKAEVEKARKDQKEDDLNMVRSQFLIISDKGEAHQRSWNAAMTQAIRVIEAGPAGRALTPAKETDNAG